MHIAFGMQQELGWLGPGLCYLKSMSAPLAHLPSVEPDDSSL
jgi:hypothetical protein